MEVNQGLNFDTFEESDDILELSGKPAASYESSTNNNTGEDILELEDKKPAAKEAEKTTVESAVNVDDITDQEEGNSSENTEDEGDTDDTYQKISESLLDMGIFSLEEGEEKISVKDPEEFAARWQNNSQRTAVNYVNQLVSSKGPQYAHLWDTVFEKGLDPYEYFGRQQQIESYEDMDLESEDVQKQVLKTYYSKQGLTPERIEQKIQKAVDLDDLADDAKEYHNILLKNEQKELEQRAEEEQANRQAMAQQQARYQESVQGLLQTKLKEKEFDGIPMTPKVAEQAMNFMFQKRYQLPDGQLWSEMDRFIHELQQPQNLELALKIAMLAPKGFKTEAIQKQAISKESNKLFNNLSNKNKQASRNQPTKGNTDFFDF